MRSRFDQPQHDSPGPAALIRGVLFWGGALFLTAALVSHAPQDGLKAALAAPGARLQNWGGQLGASVSGSLFETIGRVAYLIPLSFALLGLASFSGVRLGAALRRLGPHLLLVPGLLILLCGATPAGSGRLGIALVGLLSGFAGSFGAALVGIALVAAWMVVGPGQESLRLARLVRTRLALRRNGAAGEKPATTVAGRSGGRLFPEQGATPVPRPADPPDAVAEENPAARSNEVLFKPRLARQELLARFKEEVRERGTRPPLVTRLAYDGGSVSGAPLVATIPPPGDDDPGDGYDDGDDPLIGDGLVLAEPVRALVPEREYQDEEETAEEGDVAMPAPAARMARPRRLPRYDMPDAGLLYKSEGTIDEETRKAMAAGAEVLERTFREFGIEATVTNICRGPVITRYEMSVPPGVRLNRVVALQDNIALNLAAASVRIEAPIPGKAAVGIEVPNRRRSLVTLRDILESSEFRQSKARIPIALGQTVSGHPCVVDLAAMPHVIIAGTTGSGKSVCVNAIICSVLYNMRPERVRFILVDPKYVELEPYNGIPHLLTPVINRPRDAIRALKWLVREMERRYQALQEIGARTIESYNEKLRREPAGENGAAAMPYLVLVIDELADMMILAAREIEDSISRLAAMSRAVGIHLIFATQRPSVDVITGVIKNNFPSRIAFQVASATDSRTILDTKGADKLLGKGDGLFIGPGSPFPQRVQCAFLSEEEVDKTAAYLRSLGVPEYDMGIIESADGDGEDGEDGEGGDAADDPLFPEAVEIVLSTKRASASYLQRRLKVGYNRAARLIEAMEEQGMIGPQQGSRPRDILRAGASHLPG